MFQRRIQQMKLRIDELLYRWKSDSSIRVHDAHMAPIQVCRLEERILMSATPVAAVAAEAASLNELTDAPADNTNENLVSTENSTQETADRTSDNWSAMSTTQTREIVLVDTGADDYQQLVDDIVNNADESRGFELFLFDSNRDGIEQITELLSNYRDVDALHIVSHGTDGRVKLGNTWLSSNNFQAHGGTIAAWGQSLSSDADLLFYGCNLASNDDGRELLQSIGAVCDCDVAASDDLTGHASLGGDWDLEYATGVIDTNVAFGIEVQETWLGLFAVETLRDEFNSVSYSNNNGGVAWANDWQEIGESNGVSAGNVQVSSALGEQGLRIWQDGKGAMREADLSAATTATLTFDYARFGLDDAGDYVVIEVSANGGGSWFEVDRFQGPANDGALQSASYDISTYIASNTQIRFVSSGMTATESLFVDNVQIEYDDTVAPGGVDTNLNLWLRADAGVNLGSGKVNQWDNQVTTSPLTDVSAGGSNRPALNVSALNFNPVISFDGSDDNLRDSSVLGSDLFASNAGSTFTVARVNSSGVILQWEENTNNRVNLEQALGAPRFDFGDDVPPDRLDGSPPGAGYHILNVEAAPGGPEPNLQIFVDGRLDVQGGASSANPLNNGVTGQFVLGEWAGGGVNADMDLGEVIIFGSDLSAAEQAQVDSYLAVKYGITLDQTAATNYVDSQGNVIWNATTNSTWNNDIAGIGRDLTSTLDQSQSRSISNDAIVTMSAASDQHNREFLIWGNDDGALTETVTGNPVGVAQRLERIWRVDEAGDVGTTTITFDVNSLTITGTTAADFKLVVDTDTDFSTDVTLVGASGFAGGIVTFSSVNLADAQYFALGTDAAPGSPIGPVGDTNAAADSVPENAGVGAAVGITALASDPDGVDAVTYTLDNDAGGLFDIDLNSGVVTVAAALDYESATSHDIIVRATSTDTSSNTQLFTINVINVNEGHTGAATITGTPTEDQVLTAANTLADPDGMGSVGYQWQRNGSDIIGETGTTYILADADVGQMIRVVASYMDGGGFSESEVSAAVGAIANVNDPPTGLVTITGTPTEDQTLTANTGGISDNDGLGAFNYQWLRDAVAIGGATSSAYILGDADVGTQISVQVSYTDGHSTAEGPLTSVPTAPIANINDPPVGIPTITGTVQEGFVLTGNTGGISDNDGLGAFTYQWLRNGGAITGATSSTYNLVAADVGTNISVRVDYTDGQSTAESVTSAQTTPVSPATNSLPVGIPTIVGTTTEDQILTADTSGISDADGLGVFSYQWLRDAVAIGGATSSTYTLGDADVGTNISLRVSYTDGGANSESVTSVQTSPIANVNDAPAGVPTITGTPTEHQILTANTSGISDNDGLGTISYQWKRNGADITGATASTYTLVSADVGTMITVAASYTDGEGTNESVTSTAVGPIANVNDPPTGSVSMTGTPTEDQVLTASNTLADADGLGAISYQWQRGGVDITGATGTSYTLGDADVGTMVSVVAGYTDGGGTSESISSASVGPIANVNDAPTITTISDQIIGEEGSTGPLAFAVGDIETPTGLLTVTASSSDAVRIPNSHIVLTNLGGGNWTVEATGALDQDGGPTTITVTVGDGTTTVAETFNVLIDPVNDAPKLDPVPVQSVNEGAAVGASVVTVPATDTDAGDTLTFAIIGGNTNSDFAIAADGTITINNPLDYATTSIYHLVVQVTDSGTPALTDTVTVTIEVAAPVTAPPAPVTPDDSGDDEAEEEVVETPDPVADSPEDPAAPPTPAEPHSEAAASQEELPVILTIDNAVVAEEQAVFLETMIRTALDEVPEANELRGGLAASSLDRTLTDTLARPAYNHFELARDLQQMREELEQPAAQQFFSAATAMGTSGSLTVGYVLWALRSGWLASSVLAQMPAWRLIDPLVVLSSLDGTDGDGEDDSLQAMLKAQAGEHADSTDSDPES